MRRHMYFHHERHQHAVGHGFFHSASVAPSRGRAFNYVYDCGSKKPSKLLAPALKAYRTSLGDRQVDLLVISHFHADHANGLDILLKNTKVEAAVIPYVSAAERLLLVAQVLAKSAARFDDVTFASSPEAWLRARGVSSVVTVRGSSEGPRPDDVLEETPTPSPQQDVGWELRLGSEAGALAGDGNVLDHKNPLVVTNQRVAVWDFRFYCWSHRVQSALFTAAIKKRLGRTPEELLAPGKLSEAIRSSATLDRIRICYAEVAPKGPNWTTLCLRAGPAGQVHERLYVARSGNPLAHQVLAHGAPWFDDGPISWLGTGDLELADPDVQDEFFTHYSTQGPVRSLSLPHHGSAKNFTGRLLNHFKPSIVFATCPNASNHHPAANVVRAVSTHGSTFQKVDEVVEHELHESARFIIAR
jgi:beta-lactamase superfamily II metal-dependent hydrolase